MQIGRIRNFIFTLNNPEESEREFWQNLADNQRTRDRLQVKYVVYQEERHDTEEEIIDFTSITGNSGTRTELTLGTPHLQGYVELTRAIRLAGIKLRFGSRVHYEKRRGSQAQCIAYCTKTETRLAGGDAGEGGEAKKLGKDKLSVVAAIIKEEGAKNVDITSLSHDYASTFIKYGSKITSYILSQLPDREGPPKIIILFGKTGTGKSAYAKEKHSDAYWVPRPQKGGWWWFNYKGQQWIVLDDWRKGFCSYADALRLFDRYSMTVQMKEACMKMVTTNILITTNVDPMQWYPGLSYEEKAPLRRRLHDFAEIRDVPDTATWNNFSWVLRAPML